MCRLCSVFEKKGTRPNPGCTSYVIFFPPRASLCFFLLSPGEKGEGSEDADHVRIIGLLAVFMLQKMTDNHTATVAVYSNRPPNPQYHCEAGS